MRYFWHCHTSLSGVQVLVRGLLCGSIYKHQFVQLPVPVKGVCVPTCVIPLSTPYKITSTPGLASYYMAPVLSSYIYMGICGIGIVRGLAVFSIVEGSIGVNYARYIEV